ncbi:MAG TPA: hypothetical protein VMR96_08380 [Solirubrobacterales bacterium]|nr:hypothetical protein [Solirubrobacterales bacterium]
MKPKLTYANVTSTLALFVALTGTAAYAATKIPDRSVGEFQLRPGAVTAEKIRKNAVTAPKIKAAAIKQGKIANGAITAAKMTEGSVAAASIQGSAISNGKLAPEAVTGDKALESTFSQVPSAAKAEFAANAESGNPPAFAHISSEATVDSSLSKSIAQVKEGSLGGIYCISVAGFTPRGAQVTPRFTGEGDLTAYVRIGGTVDCAAPAVEVQTFDGGVRTKEPFYVMLYR